MKSSCLNVVDLFCGAGGLSLGFLNAGFKIIYSLDNDPRAIETYNKNLGNHGYCDDIYKLTVDKISNSIGQDISIDVIIGGPPCQGFSVQRRGEDIDNRNLLVLEYLRLVLEAKPRIFLMENVSGLLSKRGENVLSIFREKLSQEGYNIKTSKLDASHYGIPQKRKRVFLIGCRDNRDFLFPEPEIEYIQTPKTVRDTIYDLINTDEKTIANHNADKLSALNLERIRSITQGQGRDSLPEHLQLACHKNNETHRHLDTYGRMAWDQPASTITARFDSFSRGRFGHPELDRTITLREGARLQTFPDDYIFVGKKVEVARQIGNAVPPVLAEKLAIAIRKHLEDK